MNSAIVKTNETFEAAEGLQIYTDKTIFGINLSQEENYIKIHYRTKFNFNYIDVVNKNKLEIIEDNLENNSTIFYPN